MLAFATSDCDITLNVTGVGVDDPDGNMLENCSSKSERNYTQYCNADVDRFLSAQSRELDREKRRQIVWDIERILVDDAARRKSGQRFSPGRTRSVCSEITFAFSGIADMPAVAAGSTPVVNDPELSQSNGLLL